MISRDLYAPRLTSPTHSLIRILEQQGDTQEGQQASCEKLVDCRVLLTRSSSTHRFASRRHSLCATGCGDPLTGTSDRYNADQA